MFQTTNQNMTTLHIVLSYNIQWANVFKNGVMFSIQGNLGFGLHLKHQNLATR